MFSTPKPLHDPVKEVDLIRYPLTTGNVYPYFKMVTKDSLCHIYEGALGNNRFSHLILPENSDVMLAYKEFQARTLGGGQSREVLIKELISITSRFSQDAIETVIGLDAYYQYWFELSKEEKLILTYGIIPHFEALKEWYEISRQYFVSENAPKFLDTEVKAIETEKWKNGLIRAIEEEYLVFKGDSPSRKSELITSAHAKELARFYIFLLTGKNDICQVPSISSFVSDHHISANVLEAFYRLVPQPTNRAQVSPNYVGPVNQYNQPYSSQFYGAYLLKIEIELLDYKMANWDDPQGYYVAYESKAVMSSMKDYARGFQNGYDNFIKDNIERPEILKQTDEYKVQAIYDYVTNPFNRPGLSENHGHGKEEVFSNWYTDGKQGGYFYCAWFCILQNHWLFEQLFVSRITTESDQEEVESPVPPSATDSNGIAAGMGQTKSGADFGEPSAGKTKTDQKLDRLKDNRLVAIIIVSAIVIGAILEFSDKLFTAWDHWFGKTVEQPIIEAHMIVRQTGDSSVRYEFEISNSGRGVAKNITCSVKDPQFAILHTMRAETGLSPMLNAGSVMISPGDTSEIHISKGFHRLRCGLLVEYLDSSNHGRNCVFYFDIDSRNYRDHYITASDRNCQEHLAQDGPLRQLSLIDSTESGTSK